MRRSILISLLLFAALTSVAQDKLSLSLDDCLGTAKENSPLLKGTSLDVLAAKTQQKEARLEYLPKIEVTGLAYRAINPLLEVSLKDVLGNSDAANNLNNYIGDLARENGINPSWKTLKWGYGATATLMQPLYAGGRIRAGNNLADIGLEAAVIQDSLRQRVVRDSVECKYWRVVALQEKQKTLQETLSLLDSLDKDMKSALAAGLATEPQQLELSFKRNELRAGIQRLEGGLSLMKMDLLQTAGYPFKALSLRSIRLTDTLSDLPEPSGVVPPGGTEIAGTDESRLLQLQVDARIQEKKMAVGELLPQVAIGAGYGYSAMMAPKDGSFNGLVFGMVKIPITDIPKAVLRARRYDYQLQKALSDQGWLSSQLELRERMLALEVETAWNEMQNAEEAVRLAEDSLRRLKVCHEAGSAATSELLQTSLAVSSAREVLIDRRIDYRLAINKYRRCTKITGFQKN